jgi:general secretion pathway protein D
MAATDTPAVAVTRARGLPPTLVLFLALPLALLSAACVTTGLRAGQLAEQGQDYDRAVVEYTKVVKEHPDHKEARLSLDRARLRAALEHYNRGLRLRNGGRLDEALVELQIASELNPAGGDIEDALSSVRSQLRAKVAVTREGKTQLETLIARARDLPPMGVDLPADAQVPAVLTFRDASARDVFTALGRFAQVNVVFDPTYRDQPVSIDLRNSTLEAALQAVAGTTRNFYRVTAQRTITIVPDTPAKRREYEEEVVRTFFLSNADLKETMDLLRIVVDLRRVATTSATNAITIKDTPERIAAASRIITAIDKARPEVVIDVELLEIDRTRLKEYGLQLASPGDPPIGIDGAATVNRDNLTLRDLRSLTQSDIFLTNLPGLYYRLLKSDHNTRTLANPQLRTSEGIPAQAKFGERVPVPVTTFSPIATGGVAQQPITSFNYENIGVNIDITPRTHHDDQVTLAVKINISSISGVGFGGLPTFGNREINTVIRLKDGETNLLAGLIRDDERRTLDGVPGLVDLPVLGRLFAHSRRETQETDIVLTLTPRIVRVLDLSESDVRAFKVGRDGDGGPIELPIPAALPPAAAAPPAGQPPAGATTPTTPPAGGATPILPPAPGK